MQLANNIFFAQVGQMLAEGHEVQLRIQGYSMRPLLRNARDIVVLTPYRGEALHCGDIVLFRYKDLHILHRIVRIDGGRITLKGDGNYRIQEYCAYSDVMAIVRRVIRPSGREIPCDSRGWRLRSRAWQLLPALVRRYVLAILFRLGYK